MRTLLLICLLAASAGLEAAAPTRVELTFTITFGNMRIGEGRDVLVHDGKRYTVTSESKPLGLAAAFISDIRRESEGQITANGLKPDRFLEDRGRRGQRAANFDWNAQQITLRQDDRAWKDVLPAGTMDHASFQFSFMFTPPDEKGIRVPITDGRRVSEYEYRFVARETLKTPIGPIETVHYERIIDPADKRSFDVWLAVERHYLPVRIRYSEKGRTFDSIVTGISVQ